MGILTMVIAGLSFGLGNDIAAASMPRFTTRRGTRKTAAKSAMILSMRT